MTNTEIAKRCKPVFEGYYGMQFKGVVMYVSAARDEASPFSDIDLLVLLGQPFDYLRELRGKN